MIPLAVPNLSGREGEYLQECVSSTFVSTVGPFVCRFEDEIAALSGSSSACVVSSGTVALHLALEGLGIGRGDLVMLPSLTFIATPNAVRHSGADVWLADVSESDWTLDLCKARAAILAETDPHPDGRLHRNSGAVLKAIMPVMIMGSVFDFSATKELAREFNLRIIVDAAAAIGTTVGDSATPLCATGVDAVCFSFNGNKTITCGGGGAVASIDRDLVSKIKHLSSTGRVGTNYDHDVVAYNFRMTNLQAAVGSAQLERLTLFLERKQHIRDFYASVASKLEMLEPFPDPAFGRNGYWFSGLWYVGEHTELCQAFRDSMKASGIDLRAFWKPVHLQKPYLDAIAQPMSVTDRIWERIFPLPCSTHISDEELDRVGAAVIDFWSQEI